MTTITISLPDQTAKQVDTEAAKRGFATRSEFFRDLIRRYLTHEVVFEPFEKKPLLQLRGDLKKTRKYSAAFIDSVVTGIEKSSVYEK